MKKTGWIILFSILIILILGFFLFKKSIDYNIPGSDYLKKDIILLKIEENPIINNNSYIENIEFTFVIDPSTPLDDGIYGWNGCVLHSSKSFKVYNPRVENYTTTQLGICSVGEEKINENTAVFTQKIDIKNNKFKVLLYEDTLKQIKEREIDGPYFLWLFDSLFQYNVKGYKSITYNLKGLSGNYTTQSYQSSHFVMK